MTELLNMVRTETIGDATLYLGDCREIMPLIGIVDVVISDPPYGINGSSGAINEKRGKGVYLGRKDTVEDVKSIYVPAITHALGLAKVGAIIPGTPNCFEYPKPTDIAAIFQPGVQGMSRWGWPTWQPILLYGKDPFAGKTIHPLHMTSNGRFVECGHPCPKPDDVMRWIVNRCSREGDMILDPFMGSGTTGVSAIKMGRKFIGVEIEPKYFDISCRRIEEATRQPDMFIKKLKPKQERIDGL